MEILSNMFGKKQFIEYSKEKVTHENIGSFNGIIGCNFTTENAISNGEDPPYVDVGGNTTYHDIINFTFKCGYIPFVIPEFSSITIRDAICGIGVQASSFRYGVPHDRVLEMDILLANDKVITVTPRDEFFNMIPNSHGTLGKISRVRLELRECKPNVLIQTLRCKDIMQAIGIIEKAMDDPNIDFIEAIALSSDRIVVTVSHMVNYIVNFKSWPYEKPFYKMVEDNIVFTVSLYDYLWRWDPDMFWAIDQSMLDIGWMKNIFGRSLYNLSTLKTWNSFAKKCRSYIITSETRTEKIIQDVCIPRDNGIRFFHWLDENVGVYPVRICLIRTSKNANNYPLWELPPNKVYMDFVILGTRILKEDQDTNSDIETATMHMDGKKCIYSCNYLSISDFEREYNMKKYDEIKSKVDPYKRYPHLYQRLVNNRNQELIKY